MTEFTSASRSRMIAGVATDTMVESTRIMKNPTTRAHRAGHGPRSWTSSCRPARIGSEAPAVCGSSMAMREEPLGDGVDSHLIIGS
jgi:hypothetical protein